MRLLKGLANLPHFAVDNFVEHQNKERTFVQQYAWVWFVALLCWMGLTLYCYKIDFEVLYALKYSATNDASSSWKEAAFNAGVIQFLLLFCGGGFFKNLIFRDFILSISFPEKTSKRLYSLPTIVWSIPHTLQLLVLGSLFFYGFHWTLTLSQKTGALARVEAQENVESIKSNHEAKTTSLESNYDKETNNHRADAQQQIASIETGYQDQIESISNKHAAIIKQYEARLAQGLISKAHYQKRKSGHEAAKERAVAPLLQEKTQKIEAIQAALTTKLSHSNARFEDQKKAVDYQANRAHLEVDQQIEETAQNTQGRNVQYNFLNQLLWVALLIFACSARTTQPTPEPEDDQPQKAPTRTTYTVEEVQPTSHTDSTSSYTEPKNHLHDTTLEPRRHLFRWPKLGEQPREIRSGGYHIRITPKTVWAKYGDKFYSLGAIKSWARKYENEGNTDSEKYQEYCKILKVLEETKEELDELEVRQGAR